MNPNCTLTPQQVETLARPFIYMADAVKDYYKDPEHEAAFQAWHMEKYGCAAPPME